MARVLLLSATSPDDGTDEHLAPLQDLRERAERDKFGVHSMTANAAEADVILFVESYGAGWHFERIRSHPYVREFREKCFLFCANPFVIPFLPGLYTGIDRRWASRRAVSGFYLGMPKNEFTTYTPPAEDLPYLYSFMGSRENSAVRKRILQLTHRRGFVQDTSADFVRILHRRMNARERRDYYRRYAEMTKASKFVLCPRGVSVSSIRLFETMRMGRVPVILSDGWVAPVGPAWDSFSIRLPERSVAEIPRILEEREREAVAMGELARREWEEWFSEEAAFHRVVEWCLQIRDRRVIPERFARWPVYLHYVLRPFHLRRALGIKIRTWRHRVANRRSSALASSKAALREQRSQP